MHAHSEYGVYPRVFFSIFDSREGLVAIKTDIGGCEDCVGNGRLYMSIPVSAWVSHFSRRANKDDGH